MSQEDEIMSLQHVLLKELKIKFNDNKCKKCGKNKIKVILLYETNEISPSDIVLYCKSCSNNEIIYLKEGDKSYKILENLEKKMADLINIKIKEENKSLKKNNSKIWTPKKIK